MKTILEALEHVALSSMGGALSSHCELLSVIYASELEMMLRAPRGTDHRRTLIKACEALQSDARSAYLEATGYSVASPIEFEPHERAGIVAIWNARGASSALECLTRLHGGR